MPCRRARCRFRRDDISLLRYNICFDAATLIDATEAFCYDSYARRLFDDAVAVTRCFSLRCRALSMLLLAALFRRYAAMKRAMPYAIIDAIAL